MNRGIEVLQTFALPLGYDAVFIVLCYYNKVFRVCQGGAELFLKKLFRGALSLRQSTFFILFRGLHLCYFLLSLTYVGASRWGNLPTDVYVLFNDKRLINRKRYAKIKENRVSVVLWVKFLLKRGKK